MTRAPATAPRHAPPQPSWFEDANCRGKSQFFYPAPNETASDRVVRERYAAVICAACPAMLQCRAWAREQHEFGYWGGESEAARTAAGFVPRNVGERHVASSPGGPGASRGSRARVVIRPVA
jgi:WhiB family redox-sensing transcriptional regulator